MRPSIPIVFPIVLRFAFVVASASVLPTRQIGTCSPLDNSETSLPSTFALTGIHRSSGSLPRYLPLFSMRSLTLPNSTTLTVTSTPLLQKFTLDSGVLSTSEGTPCYLFQATKTSTDSLFVCSNDDSVTDPSTNILADTTWATGTQCLDVDTKAVILVLVSASGARHSKPFYVNEDVGADEALKYCVGSCVDDGPLTSLRLGVVYD